MVKMNVAVSETVSKSYVRPAILCGSGVWWFMRKRDGSVAWDGEIHGGSNVWSTA